MKTYHKDGKALVIKPEIPKWFIVDEVGFAVMQQLIAGEDLHTVVSSFDDSQKEAIHQTYEDLAELLEQDKHQIEKTTTSRSLTAKTSIAMISVTRNCNLQNICPHCYVEAGGPRGDDLTVEEHRQIGRQLVACLATDPKVTYKVTLTGGEPFANKQIHKIIDAYQEVGLEVNMSSNALLIKEENIRFLADRHVDISVSLDGASAPTHDRIRGKGAWEQTIAIIRQMSEAGVRVGINYLAHEGSLKELEDLITLSHQLGCTGFNPINLVQLGRACGSSLRRVGETEIFRRIANHLALHPEQAHLFRATSLFSSLGAALLAGVSCASCGVGERPCVYIDERGNVFPCSNTQKEEFRLGNLREHELRDCLRAIHPVTRRLKRLNVSSMNSRCANCDVRLFCGGDCRGETYNVTGDLTAPYVACQDRHDSIIELMWIVSQQASLFEDRADEFVANLR